MTTQEKLALISSKIDTEMINVDNLLTILQYIDLLQTDLPIIEIGCYRGGTSSCIAEYLTETKKPQGLVVIDPFEQFIDQHPDWPTGTGNEAITRSRLEPYPQVEIIKGFSFAVPPRDASLIFLDGDHSTPAFMQDVTKWRPYAKEYFLFHDLNYEPIQKALAQLGLPAEEISHNLGKL